jgi:small-conductance mechanosensitive channel
VRIFIREFWQGLWRESDLHALVSTGIKALWILLLYWLAKKILHRLIDEALERLVKRSARAQQAEAQANRLRTLQTLVQSIASYVLLFVLVITLLQTFSVNVTGLITTAGIGGLAIGFGAQKLVRDVITGFFLIVEDQFSVGDYVTIGSATGVVEELGMRSTRVRDDQGRLWILSNGDITTVTNHSRAPIQAFIEIGIAATAEIDRAQALINAVGEALYAEPGHGLLAPPKVLGVSAFDGAKTTLRIVVVAEPRTLTKEELRVREAIRQQLVQAGIPLA